MAMRAFHLLIAGGFLQHLLQIVALHPRNIVLVFQERPQRIADHLRGQRARIEFGDRLGIWTENGKLASIGISIKEGKLYHGVAINLYPTAESFLVKATVSGQASGR